MARHDSSELTNKSNLLDTIEARREGEPAVEAPDALKDGYYGPNVIFYNI
jgi:hypothetical protein